MVSKMVPVPVLMELEVMEGDACHQITTENSHGGEGSRGCHLVEEVRDNLSKK